MILTLGAFLIRTLLVSAVAVELLLLLKKRSAAIRHVIAAAALLTILLLVIDAWPTLVRAGYSPPHRFSTPVTMSQRYDRYSGVELLTAHWSPSIKPDESVHRMDLAVGVLELIYLAGVALLAIRLGLGLLALGLRIRRAKPFRTDLDSRLLIDPSAPSPSTAWFGRSVILLPSEAVAWPDGLLAAVLKHEQVHIERADWWWNLFGMAACSFAWPNPLAWFLHRRCRELSESAVDDTVLRSGLPASTYAQHLLQIATQAKAGREGLSLAMVGKPEISKRIESVMNHHQNRGAATVAAILLVAALQAGLMTLLSNWGFIMKPTFGPMLSSAPAPPKATPAPGQFEVSETWYVIDADPQAQINQASLQSLSDSQLKQTLHDRHGRMAKQAKKILNVSSSEPSKATISPQDVVSTSWVALDPNEMANFYEEAIVLHPGILEFELQDGKTGGPKPWSVFVSTFSEGMGTDWLHHEKGHICQIAPPVGNRQLMIVHEFR